MDIIIISLLPQKFDRGPFTSRFHLVVIEQIPKKVFRYHCKSTVRTQVLDIESPMPQTYHVPRIVKNFKSEASVSCVSRSSVGSKGSTRVPQLLD